MKKVRDVDIKKYVVIKKELSNFIVYFIVEVLKVRRLRLRSEYLNKSSCDIVLQCLSKYQCYSTGKERYINFKHEMDYDTILKYLIYQSDSFDGCKDYIDMLVNTDRYNL